MWLDTVVVLSSLWEIGFDIAQLSRQRSCAGQVKASSNEITLSSIAIVPRVSRYQIIKDLGPKSHNNHGL